MEIRFNEWSPDLPDYKNPGCTVAKNVIPAGVHYEPFLGASVYSNALDARCQGAFSAKDSDGNTVNFAGDAAKLYKMAAAAYADASLAGGYITSTEEMWSFTQFGSRVIATNFADNPQTITMPAGTNFANLTTALKARYVANINSFLVFGNTYDAVDGNVPHRIRWSALGDPTDYTVSPVTQADYQDLDPSKGWVRQVVSGEYGVIFQERAISRMDYAGSPLVFAFREIETGRGTQAPGSVIKIGNIIYYLGTDLGFWAFDGNQSYSIGENKINKTFRGEFDTGYLGRVSATADLDKQLIYWAYAASGNTNGLSNKILCYNYSPNAQKRWSYVEPGDIEIIYTSLSEGYTLDSLDNINTNIDLITQSFDSRVWTGENYILSGFNSSHKQVNFTGTALDAVLETNEFQLYPSNRADVTLVRPLAEGASTVTVQMGTRTSQGDSVAYSSAVSANNAGDFPVRSNSRYHRVRVNITGGFTDVQGVEIVKAAKAGGR